jgi:hypothetical protein
MWQLVGVSFEGEEPLFYSKSNWPEFFTFKPTIKNIRALVRHTKNNRRGGRFLGVWTNSAIAPRELRS